MDAMTAGPRGASAPSGPGSDRPTILLRELFLGRLSRLAILKAMLDASDLERRLLDRALYSTYWDCVQLDLREQARRILELPDQEPVATGEADGVV